MRRKIIMAVVLLASCGAIFLGLGPKPPWLRDPLAERLDAARVRLEAVNALFEGEKRAIERDREEAGRLMVARAGQPDRQRLVREAAAGRLRAVIDESVARTWKYYEEGAALQAEIREIESGIRARAARVEGEGRGR